MRIHLFGATTPSGAAFRSLAQMDLVGYSRKGTGVSNDTYYADLNDPEGFHLVGGDEPFSILVSFGPIWLLAPFLDRLATHYPDRLRGVRGVFACSSSSVITKNFAYNLFDRQLVARLISAEDQLLATCRLLSVPCCILRPTIIYGKSSGLCDRNLSRLLKLMRHLPLLPLPAFTGLRQPIHSSQLANVVLHLANQLAAKIWDPCTPERLALGGDSTLTYTEMIRALQLEQSPGDPARRCWLLPIPNRLFFFLAAPMLLHSPKAFEAVLRMTANLSGFTPAHQLLGKDPQPFPVLPLG